MKASESDKRAAGGRYWPDRTAHRHRKRAHQAFFALAVVLVVVPWFGYRHLRGIMQGDEGRASPATAPAAPSPSNAMQVRTPEQAGQPLDPLQTARRMAAIRAAALAGDQATVRRQVDAMNEDMRKAMRLADPGRAVDREAARTAVRRIPGVRAAGWIDRSHLFVVVASNDLRSQAMIDTVCLQLEPLGDTLGVVVNLQSGAATTGIQLEILSRNCQLAPGERALLQAQRKIDVLDPALRTRVQADNVDIDDDAERRARNEESMRILEESTPEM